MYMILDNIEYLDHMTDGYLRCKGKTLTDAFQFAAKGLVNMMYDLNYVEKKLTIPITAEGFDLENLLFDWLEKVLLIILINKILLTEFHIIIHFNKELNKYYIKGHGEGELINDELHELKVEIKGITYHEMRIIKDRYDDMFIIEYIIDL